MSAAEAERSESDHSRGASQITDGEGRRKSHHERKENMNMREKQPESKRKQKRIIKIVDRLDVCVRNEF